MGVSGMAEGEGRASNIVDVSKGRTQPATTENDQVVDLLAAVVPSVQYLFAFRVVVFVCEHSHARTQEKKFT